MAGSFLFGFIRFNVICNESIRKLMLDIKYNNIKAGYLHTQLHGCACKHCYKVKKKGGLVLIITLEIYILQPVATLTKFVL